MVLDEVIQNSDFQKYGLIVCENNEVIFEYLYDCHGSNIIKALEETEKNTGVALFFDDERTSSHLVVVVRTKNFEDEKYNGFTMFIIPDIYKNAQCKEFLIQKIRDGFNNSTLAKEVIINIEAHAIRSVELNVK